MSNKCTFCCVHRPTDHLILGTRWFEFCADCGKKETLQRVTEEGQIEIKTIREVFDSLANERSLR